MRGIGDNNHGNCSSRFIQHSRGAGHPCLKADPFACGVGLTCQWTVDTDTRGAFILSHPGAIAKTQDPLLNMVHDFISPSKFWEVKFDSIREDYGPDFPDLPLDAVTIKGYMQHIMRPLGDFHITDPQMGDKFPFSLVALALFSGVDMASGTEPHGHTDTYFALLQGDIFKIDGGFVDYNFGVKGMHTEFFGTPGVPEPGTFLLLGSGLLAILVRKARTLRR